MEDQLGLPLLGVGFLPAVVGLTFTTTQVTAAARAITQAMKATSPSKPSTVYIDF
jgi:hypothetical protein